MSLKKYEKVYLENKEKIKEWEKTLKEDEEKGGTLRAQREALIKEKDELRSKIKERQIIVDMYQKLYGESERALSTQQEPIGETIYNPTEQDIDNERVFVMHGSGHGGRVYNASLKKIGKFYYVQEGSLVSSNISNTKGNKAPKLRKAHKAMLSSRYKVKSPIPFPSPTAAATYVMGYNVVGGDVWIDTRTGKALREFEEVEGGE